MSVNALTLASGVDLLQRYEQAAGQSPAAGEPRNTKDLLVTAVKEAQMSEASVTDGGDRSSPGALLNTYA